MIFNFYFNQYLNSVQITNTKTKKSKIFSLIKNYKIQNNRLGKPGVDSHVRHEGDSACAVIHIVFLVNEGALVSVTADDTLHLWNFRQKSPQVVQSLKFQRER